MISLQKWSAVHRALEPLSDLDWRVVEAARSDGPRSLNPDGLIARLFRLLGVPVARPLANDGLEALRRFSVRAWYWDLIRGREMLALYAAGYSTNHAEQVLAHVATARGFTPTIMNHTHDARHAHTVG